MSDDNKSRGVGISTVVGIVFVILKLCGLIDWSWVWVLCPFWLPVVLILLVILLAAIKGFFDNIFYG